MSVFVEQRRTYGKLVHTYKQFNDVATWIGKDRVIQSIHGYAFHIF